MVHPHKFGENPSIDSRDILQGYDLENRIKVTKTVTCLTPVTIIYPFKSDE